MLFGITQPSLPSLQPPADQSATAAAAATAAQRKRRRAAAIYAMMAVVFVVLLTLNGYAAFAPDDRFYRPEFDDPYRGLSAFDRPPFTPERLPETPLKPSRLAFGVPVLVFEIVLGLFCVHRLALRDGGGGGGQLLYCFLSSVVFLAPAVLIMAIGGVGNMSTVTFWLFLLFAVGFGLESWLGLWRDLLDLLLSGDLTRGGPRRWFGKKKLWWWWRGADDHQYELVPGPVPASSPTDSSILEEGFGDDALSKKEGGLDNKDGDGIPPEAAT